MSRKAFHTLYECVLGILDHVDQEFGLLEETVATFRNRRVREGVFSASICEVRRTLA